MRDPGSAAELQQVRSLLEQGRCEDAVELCERLGKTDDSAERLHLHGLAELLSGNTEDAERHLRRAAERAPGRAVVHCNLGEALRRLGRLTEAEQALRTALELDPEYAVAEYNLGCVLRDGGDPAGALEQFESAVSRQPANARFMAAKADALRELRRLRLAIAAYHEALALDPGQAAAHSNLGVLLLLVGREQEALEHCRTAVEMDPESGTMRMNQGRCLLVTEQLDAAMDCFADALELMPDSAPLCTLVGKTWLEVEDLAQAEHWFLRALESDPEFIEAGVGLAATLRRAKLLDQARERLEVLVEAHPDDAGARRELAETWWDLGDAPRAVEHLREAAALAPWQATLLTKSGDVLASAGAMDEAVDCFRAALGVNPRCVNALHGLASTLRGRLPGGDLRLMRELLEDESLGEGAQAALHNGLAHVCDAREEWAEAAAHARRGAELQWAHRSRRGWDYDPAEFAATVDYMAGLFTPELLAELHGCGDPTTLPVFIVGMPRSGTTLTEQILACHPGVLGIGEREFASDSGAFLRRKSVTASQLAELVQSGGLAEVARGYGKHLDQLRSTDKPAAVRVVDKCPDNYLLLGWLTLLFPQVRIIHCRRDPRDVAISCFLTQFGMIRWACHPEHIVHRLAQYRRMMAHWREALPVPMLEIDYETTVADLEGTARRMLDFLGLEFDRACLAPHVSDRLVRTASVSQVRRPVYRRSVARWRAYAPYLPDLIDKIDALPQAG